MVHRKRKARVVFGNVTPMINRVIGDFKIIHGRDPTYFEMQDIVYRGEY